MSLSVKDLRTLHRVTIKAKNEARRAAAAEAGADALRALRVDGFRAQLSVSPALQALIDHADRLSALAVRVGEEVDDALVATDASGRLYPAARERVLERQAAEIAALRDAVEPF